MTVAMCLWKQAATRPVNPARFFLKVIAGLCLLLCFTAVQAHREQTVFTTIELNARTGMMEIVHRCSVHDLTHIMTPAMQVRGGLEDLRTRAELALAMSEDFEVTDATGRRLDLQLIGAEVDSGDFYVYQEAPAQALPAGMQVRHDILRHTWPDITNYLNVHYPEGVRSLIFTETSGLLTLTTP